MNNKDRMSDHSNLMLVDIIHGNSPKYTQNDVLEAEIELSRRNVSVSEMELLKRKVRYINGISIGTSGSGSSDSNSSSGGFSGGNRDNGGALDNTDSILLNVLIGYIALTSLGALFSVFHGSFISQIISVGMLGVGVYGIYGLLNRQSFPVILLIGLFSMNLIRAITALITLLVSFELSIAFMSLISVAIAAYILYFLTKASMRKAFALDSDDIKKAIGIGIVLSFLLALL